MFSTLKLSLSLKNTYRVNSILYSLKQIPLIKRLLPQELYGVRGFKLLANILALAWELVTVFLGRAIFFLLLLGPAAWLFKDAPPDRLFLHVFVGLAMMAALIDTKLFDPSRDKYYAMVLLRMNARQYTLANYGYSLLKIFLGQSLLLLIFAPGQGLGAGLCLLLPLSAVALRLVLPALLLRRYEKTGLIYNENRFNKAVWIVFFLLLAFAYGLPALGLILPQAVSLVILLAALLPAAWAMQKLLRFPYYKEVYRELLHDSLLQMDEAGKAQRRQNNKMISADQDISSNKQGFEYLNELFIKRHRRILWRATKKITLGCAAFFLLAALALLLLPQYRAEVNQALLSVLPIMAIFMYSLNRGTGFTRALFMNCDHSLLTYSFYKQPKFVLQLFQIRLREIMKINLVPAGVIGLGLSGLLYLSGGTDNPWNYPVLLLTVPVLSLFFSVHYLTVYYLLQPYNAATEMKSATYQIVMTATYLVCFYAMKLDLSSLSFGLLCIGFCLLYGLVACLLVYKLAPRTFRLRS